MATGVQFDFSEFEAHVDDFKRDERQALDEQIAATSALIQNASYTEPLPTQAEASQLLHQAVLGKFAAANNGKNGGKSEFMKRKARKKQQRSAKKGADHNEKITARLTKKITKTKKGQGRMSAKTRRRTCQ